MRAQALMAWPAVLSTPTPGVDVYGDDADDVWITELVTVQAYPSGSSEHVEGRTAATEWTVYLPPETVASRVCRLALEGGPMLELTGDPMPFRSPRSRTVEFLTVPARVVS